MISAGHGATDRMHVIRKRNILRVREKGTRGKGRTGKTKETVGREIGKDTVHIKRTGVERDMGMRARDGGIQ